MFRSFALVLLALPLQAQTPPPLETLLYTVSLQQQSCARATADEPFLCTSDPPLEAPLNVLLSSTDAGTLEQEAAAGVSDDVGLTLPGGRGQYLPKLTVRKSSADGHAIYTMRFQTVQFLSADKPTVFETVYIGEVPAHEPVVLMADRESAHKNQFKQTVFTLRPSR